MGQWVDLEAADGQGFKGYVAEPSGAMRGALVVIQEIFGVNAHMRHVTDDFATQGFLAICPALFDRVEPGVDYDYGEASIAKGRALRDKIMPDAGLMDVSAALDWAKGHAPGKTGVVGYCMGGTLAWMAATRLHPAASVCYYGSGIAGHAGERPNCPVIFHFGERDSGIPMSDVRIVEKAHPDLSVFVYPAGHGFNCDQRASYDAQAASLARARTIDFLRKYLT